MGFDFISWWNDTPWAWVVLGIIVGILALALYFLPTIIARKRTHKNSLAIFALNLLLGATVIGWIIALIWACTDNTKKQGGGNG